MINRIACAMDFHSLSACIAGKADCCGGRDTDGVTGIFHNIHALGELVSSGDGGIRDGADPFHFHHIVRRNIQIEQVGAIAVLNGTQRILACIGRDLEVIHRIINKVNAVVRRVGDPLQVERHGVARLIGIPVRITAIRILVVVFGIVSLTALVYEFDLLDPVNRLIVLALDVMQRKESIVIREIRAGKEGNTAGFFQVKVDAVPRQGIIVIGLAVDFYDGRNHIVVLINGGVHKVETVNIRLPLKDVMQIRSCAQRDHLPIEIEIIVFCQPQRFSVGFCIVA